MQSLWSATCEMPRFPSLKGDIKCDVLVIGGGIAGLLTAFLLKEKGACVVLCEKGNVASGTTANTTAKITVQHGLIFDKLIKSVGLYNAKGYLNANIFAMKELLSLCKKTNCDLETKDNYIYSINKPKKLEKELKATEKLGYNSVFKSDLPLPFKTVGAVCFQKQAQFHPLKFLQFICKDLTIYENTHIKEMIGTTAASDNGNIHAENVIVTTHYPFINKHGLYPLKLYQKRSYVSAFQNAPNLDGMYLDENEKGFSFRNYNNVLLIGCGSHRTGKKTTAPDEIESLKKAHYPNAERLFSWAAQDCITLDNMPYIGKYSKNTHNFFTATGFCKWGMTGSALSAILLCDLIFGKTNEWHEIFSPSRSMLHPQLLFNSFESAVNLLNPKPKHCPHLGCALKWNEYEHTWDCSCHGSRFSENGKLLDGPANNDL